jgi:hypothetical protein
MSPVLSGPLKFIAPLVFALLCGMDPAAAAGVAPPLDQKAIHAEYNEGNFEPVIAALEGYMAKHASYSHSDSVFIAKHLAVIYTANQATREKGKYYMHRLLELLPSAKLVDMYVSDEIDRIFDKIREEFMARRRHFGIDDTVAVPSRHPAGASGKATARAEPRERSQGGHAALWLLGGAVVAGAGAAAAYYFHPAEEPASDRVFHVPGR